MRVTIHQPQFLPWLGYLDKIDQADLFIVLDSVQFKKTSGKIAIGSESRTAANGSLCRSSIASASW